jgi:hypothetical protein
LYRIEKKSMQDIVNETGIGETTVRRIVCDVRKVGGIKQYVNRLEPPVYARSIPPEPDSYGRIVEARKPDCILVIPDIQAPFQLPDALEFLEMVANEYQADAVVGIGDEIDMGWLSRYEKYPEIDEPSKELEKAQEFMGRLFKRFPKALALTSNHVHGRMQSARKVARILPEMMVQWEQLIGAPKGWRWAEELQLGDLLIRHGDKWPKLTASHLTRATPDKYGKHFSILHGHIHSEAGVVATCRVGDEDYWAAYTGCLMNPRSKAADYVKAPNLKLGCVVINRGVLHRIPYRRDQHTMLWTGKLTAE